MQPETTPRRGHTVLTLALLGLTALGVQAANHREAPITALDHKADITDMFAFVSYDDRNPSAPPSKVSLVVCMDPLLEPGNGPTLFPFDPMILYEVKVDNELYVRDYAKCVLCYKCVEACGEDAQNTFAIAVAGRPNRCRTPSSSGRRAARRCR